MMRKLSAIKCTIFCSCSSKLLLNIKLTWIQNGLPAGLVNGRNTSKPDKGTMSFMILSSKMPDFLKNGNCSEKKLLISGYELTLKSLKAVIITLESYYFCEISWIQSSVSIADTFKASMS
jgi:hypothetical protein